MSDLNKEIDDALEGMNLQELDLGSGPRGSGRPGDPRLYPGVVTGITGDDVFVELGPRLQGVVSAGEFDELPEVGARFEFTMRGKDRDNDLMLLSRRDAQALASWQELQPGDNVKARVTGQNSGGLQLKVGPLDAFMPASQVAVGRVEDLSGEIGQSYVCQVIEVDRDRKRIVLSRRRVLEAELSAARDEAVGRIAPGQKVRGKVTRVEKFGAFVDIGGGIEGLVHVSNLSRKRIEDPTEFVQKGAEVEVLILDIKEGGRRIGLGMKQLEPNPWDDAQYRFQVDSTVTGKVSRLAEFGVFVELAPGLDGLIHVSQLVAGRAGRVQDVCKVGEEVAVRILDVDPAAQRLSLSRLDKRGAVIGSEEAVDESELSRVMEDAAPKGNLGTNLGSLFKKALGDDKG